MSYKCNHTKEDFKVGQKVCLLADYLGDAYRRIKDKQNFDEWIMYGYVEKIGKKYISVNIGNDECPYIEKFNIDCNFTQYHNIGSADYYLFPSKESAYDAWEYVKLVALISKNVSSTSKPVYTIEQIRKCAEILGLR